MAGARCGAGAASAATPRRAARPSRSVLSGPEDHVQRRRNLLQPLCLAGPTRLPIPSLPWPLEKANLLIHPI